MDGDGGNTGAKVMVCALFSHRFYVHLSDPEWVKTIRIRRGMDTDQNRAGFSGGPDSAGSIETDGYGLVFG